MSSGKPRVAASTHCIQDRSSMAGWMPRHAAQCHCLKGSASSKPFAHALVRSMRPRPHVDRMPTLSANDPHKSKQRVTSRCPWQPRSNPYSYNQRIGTIGRSHRAENVDRTLSHTGADWGLESASAHALARESESARIRQASCCHSGWPGPTVRVTGTPRHWQVMTVTVVA